MLNNFKIGNAHDNMLGTGCTVILAESGAIGGCSVRGGAPGTRETDLLRSENAVSELNAVVLSGGSAFGLEASCGVMEYLKEKGIGYNAGDYHVPIVASAVLYDLSHKAFAYPDKKMGYKACENAKENNFECGSIGAGTGATVGKIMGIEHSSKGGLGVAVVTSGEIELCAVVAVNAFGDVVDYRSNRVIAGVQQGGAFLGTSSLITSGMSLCPTHSNTTIGCIITNAKLTKPEANKLADITHDALAMCIRPVHTSFDGDSIFCMASGEKKANFVLLGEMAIEAMTEAIMRSVKTSDELAVEDMDIE